MALAASFASTRVYPDAAAIVASLSGAWACVTLCFALLVKRGFLGTFFSLETGHAWAKSYFLDGGGDEVKKRIFEHNRRQWRSVRGEVREWIEAGWERWEEERPGWFDEAWKATVDEDMLPTARAGAGGGEGRVAPVSGGRDA